ncbi:hypothetical protein J3Q64DRAFT_1831938 [Phycomyces blakesleeanus]|uniref:PX domain-containing protein n=2 Tax=Phycomyces blakesleeanus TaxID=4837 RepID=A0A162UME6_PHYB8|nr:hypothetical protein PHYBLDRAFT_76077 [Phycomyces blakesleeanus NRRL 1555(-)]OAD76333.1 hypothetical protein PHYBLDRAFT_76077 [Phycomyces blakesleeanus NRRL 1555(-)]|eukprot:XP_018294373.1 hypothetical protein PHYBLDRAFT_76077 [Phycomyces blakesleeanus NRRL 1555(-)]
MYSSTELHYFKRELVDGQLRSEVASLRRHPSMDGLLSKESGTYPFLNFLFQRCIVQFPLLKRTDGNAFWNKTSVFLDELAKLNLNTYSPKHTGASQRRIMAYKLQKMLTITLCAAIKSIQGNEDNLKPSLLEDKEQQETEQEKQLSKDMAHQLNFLENEENYLAWIGASELDIDVITVRQASEKRTLREVIHAEFVVQTTVLDRPDLLVVARRHGQFRQLYDDLKANFPMEDVPYVPSKARDPSYTSHSSSTSDNHLYREKDRILLRGFLRRVASNHKLANSSFVADFLQKDPIKLNADETSDVEKRMRMDKARAEEERRFREQVDQKVNDLNDLLEMLKKQIVQPGGLLQVFEIIKKTETIDKLPEPLLKAFEWGRINFAFVLHTQFVTSDKAIENISNLKRTHGLMPYRTMAKLLKHSNPFTIVKGILDLFLAQPFGGRSLFQRMVASNMNEDAKEAQKDATELEKAISHPDLCKKLKAAVNTPLPDNVVIDESSYVVSTLKILQEPSIEPVLPASILDRLVSQQDKPEVRLEIKQLHSLWVIYAHQHEQELLTNLVFQGATGELVRELFAIFYQPLAQVYKSANIGESIKHLSAFIDDLLQVVDGLNVEDVTNSTQLFVQLVQRHEQHFYAFVHNVHAQDTSNLFDELLAYVDQLFGFLSRGIPGKIDLLETIRKANLSTSEEAALKSEMEALCDYHRRRKEIHLQRTRQKLLESSDEAMLDFLPNHSEMAGVLNDFAEMEYEEDDEEEEEEEEEEGKEGGNKNKVVHEMTLEMPKLTIIPRITPVFLEEVVGLMQSSNVQ